MAVSVESDSAAGSSLARLNATPTLARQTLIYAVSGFIGPAIAIFTLPVFARVFSPAQYGVLELGTTLTALALTVTDLGLVAASQRSYYDHGDDDLDGRRRVLATAFLASSALTVVVVAALLVFRAPVSTWLFGEEELTVLGIIAASLLPLNTFRFISETMRLRFEATHYLVTSAIATVLTAVLSVLAVTVGNLGVNGVFLAALVGNLIACTYGLLIVRHSMLGRFSRPELRTMLVFGLPLVPTVVIAWLLALVDRVLLAKLGDLSEVGNFAIASRLTLLLLLAVNAFMLAIGPFLYALHGQDAAVEKDARGRLLTYFAFILSLGALLTTLFAHEVLAVLAPAFVDARWAVGPLAFGTIAYGLANLLTFGFTLSRRTVHVALLSVAAAVANVTFNVALIPPFGFVGASFATATGYLVLAVTYYVVSQRLYPTPYEPGRVVRIVVAAAAFAAIGIIPVGSEVLALVLKVACVGAFGAALVVTRAMTAAEWRELRRFVTGMVAPGRVAGAE